MSSQYKENKFSIESLSGSRVRSQDNIDKTARPNIDELIKRVLSEKRREKKNNKILGAIFLSIFLFFIFFNTN
jgi:hypothetical protein